MGDARCSFPPFLTLRGEVNQLLGQYGPDRMGLLLTVTSLASVVATPRAPSNLLELRRRGFEERRRGRFQVLLGGRLWLRVRERGGRVSVTPEADQRSHLDRDEALDGGWIDTELAARGVTGPRTSASASSARSSSIKSSPSRAPHKSACRVQRPETLVGERDALTQQRLGLVVLAGGGQHHREARPQVGRHRVLVAELLARDVVPLADDLDRLRPGPRACAAARRGC